MNMKNDGPGSTFTTINENKSLKDLITNIKNRITKKDSECFDLMQKYTIACHEKQAMYDVLHEIEKYEASFKK